MGELRFHGMQVGIEYIMRIGLFNYFLCILSVSNWKSWLYTI